MKRWLLVLGIILLLSGTASAALGITPAKTEFNFVPGAEHEITYRVLSDKPDQEIEIYVEGDLAKYATVSKEVVFGADSFVFKLKFPSEADVPGPHQILVGAREVPSEDQFIGVAVNIRALVKVFIPYPGRYIEVGLTIPNGNTGDEIPIEAHAINRGKESLTISPMIDFKDSNGEVIETMSFSEVTLDTGQDRFFRKFLNTEGFSSGDYVATAVFDYGEITSVNKSFRIGSLFVNVTNITDKLPKKGIQKFYVDVESLWNDPLDEVYADVNVSNDAGSILFRTPSVSLEGWSKKTLEGFLDTKDLEGNYDVSVALKYAGKTSFAFGSLIVFEPTNWVIIGGIAGAVMLIIIILIVLIIIFKKRKKGIFKK